jgi:hypothetical protein
LNKNEAFKLRLSLKNLLFEARRERICYEDAQLRKQTYPLRN